MLKCETVAAAAAEDDPVAVAKMVCLNAFPTDHAVRPGSSPSVEHVGCSLGQEAHEKDYF